MPEIIGYGEDGLTFLGLKDYEKTKLLINYNDTIEESKRFYRPSFGRGKYYGEFDAIVVTKTSIYLIESKWQSKKEKSSEIDSDNKKIFLRAEQIKRHAIFEWFKKNWGNLTEEKETEFFDKFGKKVVPETSLVLAPNIDYIFGDFKDKDIFNILAYFYPADYKAQDYEGFSVEMAEKDKNKLITGNKLLYDSICNTKFQVKPIPYSAITETGFIQIGD